MVRPSEETNEPMNYCPFWGKENTYDVLKGPLRVQS